MNRLTPAIRPRRSVNGSVSIVDIAAKSAFWLFGLGVVFLVVLIFLVGRFDADEYWSDDPQEVIAFFNLESEIECLWCGLGRGEAAYQMTDEEISAGSSICLFGNRPAAENPRSLAAHQMVSDYAYRLQQSGRHVSAGISQEGFVLLRPVERGSFVALIHTKRIDLVLPNPAETHCYDADEIVLISRPTPNSHYEILTRDAQ